MTAKLLLKLKPEFWDIPPFVEIEIDGVLQSAIDLKVSNEIIEYKYQLNNDQSHQIKIKRFGKLPSDTLVDNNEVIKDQLLHIEDIIIDDVSIKNLLHLGNFYPDYPEPWASEQRKKGIELPEVENYRSTFYHNGIWILDFKLPIHIWFFTNINR